MPGPRKHTMLSKDPATMTGVCALCGPTGLYEHPHHGGRGTSLLCVGGRADGNKTSKAWSKRFYTYVGRRGQWRHRLTEKNKVTLTAVCSKCGPTTIKGGSLSGRKNPSYRCVRSVQASERFRHYGITEDQFDTMVAKQRGACAICLTVGPLAVDHDKETRAIRGLLCILCNMSIGGLSHDIAILRRAIKYLQKWKRAASH